MTWFSVKAFLPITSALFLRSGNLVTMSLKSSAAYFAEAGRSLHLLNPSVSLKTFEPKWAKALAFSINDRPDKSSSMVSFNSVAYLIKSPKFSSILGDSFMHLNIAPIHSLKLSLNSTSSILPAPNSPSIYGSSFLAWMVHFLISPPF